MADRTNTAGASSAATAADVDLKSMTGNQFALYLMKAMRKEGLYPAARDEMTGHMTALANRRAS